MRRYAENDMARWFQKPRRKPLVIRGARQVGKSTLVRNFAIQKGLTLHEVNLERHRKLNNVFAEGDTSEVIRELAYACNSGPITGEQSLLFLDEIQATPNAIAFLRYLYEDIPELAVVAAGSLLEFSLEKHDYSMPVGRIEYLFLGPMTFSEFLLARGEEDLEALLSTFVGANLPATAHERLLRHFRDYLFIGGMPEAVLADCQGEDSSDVTDVHNSIIETYIDDFGKYARDSQLARLQTVFTYVPRGAGQKVVYSRIDPHSQARDMKPIVDLLLKARIILAAHHCDANGAPLRAEVDWRIRKLYFLDVGLLNSMCGAQHISIELLRAGTFINEGVLAEQFTAQHLLFASKRNVTPELNYWLREGKSNNAEIDFLLVTGRTVVPVEVKAGKAGSLKSLHRFMHDKHLPEAVRLDLNLPSQQNVDVKFRLGKGAERVQYKLRSVPIYVAEHLPRLLACTQTTPLPG
jgi:uncharacterized protein